MTSKKRDYYEVLRVDPWADPDEIKLAYHNLAKEYSDVINGSTKEGPRYEKWLEIRDAYEVLSNKKLRTLYDIRPVEAVFLRPRYDDKSNSIKLDEVYLPENDLGLIAALIEANLSTTDGVWNVRPSSLETRAWMPNKIYMVKKSGGRIKVFRTVKDWRDPALRYGDIFIGDPENLLTGLNSRVYGPDTLFGEEFLVGNLQDMFTNEIGQIIPGGYGNYLNAVKSYAQKIAEGRTDYLEELRSISDYGKYGGHRFSKIEDLNNPIYSPEEWGWVRKYNVDFLPAFIEDARELVSRNQSPNQGVERAKKLG